MRKSIISQDLSPASSADSGWLDLERIAQVQVTSEDPAHPIEDALLPNPDGAQGWGASEAGEQKIRILFDTPQKIRRVRLRFNEMLEERTQEFALRWGAGVDKAEREILRQQYCFSPSGSTSENEEYTVELDGVMILEISIIPDIRGGTARASLAQLRLSSE
jgi:hypothetical protein